MPRSFPARPSMSTPQPAPRNPWFRLPPRAGWLIAAAVALGGLLFLLLWLAQRDDRDFDRTGTAPPTAAGQTFEPLPAPPPAGSDSASGMTAADPDAPPPRMAERIAPPPPPPAPAPQAPPAPPSAVAASAPLPIDMPAPRYPASALRRGETGEVLLRIEVDDMGRAVAVDIVQGSGSRELDRAALAAARNWRFRPALRDGQPVAGTVNVPIIFDSRR